MHTFHISHAAKGRPIARPTAVVRPFLGHNALFYSCLTRSSDHGRRGSIRLGRDSGAQAAFEAEIMGSFSPEMLFRTMKSLLAATAMALVLSAGTAERATAQGAVKSVHDDWQVRCDATADRQGGQCAALQD